jgi:hypothetical protein
MCGFEIVHLIDIAHALRTGKGFEIERRGEERRGEERRAKEPAYVLDRYTARDQDSVLVLRPGSPGPLRRANATSTRVGVGSPPQGAIVRPRERLSRGPERSPV